MPYTITVTMEGNDLSQLIAQLSRLQGVTPAELNPAPSQDPIDTGVGNIPDQDPPPDQDPLEDQNKDPEPPEDPEQPEDPDQDPVITLFDLQEAGMKAAKRVAAKRGITSAAAIKVVQATIGEFTPSGQGSAREVPPEHRPGLLKALAELK